jgi:hypothetical protein
MPDSAAVKIQILRRNAATFNRVKTRAALNDFLKVAYGIYVNWKQEKHAKRSARELARQKGIRWRKGMSPIRVLIEASLPNADFRQKSRWVRALEYIYSEDVREIELRKFLKHNGGFAGCAALSARTDRKRRRSREEGDWSD